MSNGFEFGQPWGYAVCDCGWSFTRHWRDDHAAQERAIEEHWADRSGEKEKA